MTMATTIQISEDLLSALKSKKQIELAKKRMDKGHFYTHEQVKKELGL